MIFILGLRVRITLFLAQQARLNVTMGFFHFSSNIRTSGVQQ